MNEGKPPGPHFKSQFINQPCVKIVQFDQKSYNLISLNVLPPSINNDGPTNRDSKFRQNSMYSILVKLTSFFPLSKLNKGILSSCLHKSDCLSVHPATIQGPPLDIVFPPFLLDGWFVHINVIFWFWDCEYFCLVLSSYARGHTITFPIPYTFNRIPTLSKHIKLTIDMSGTYSKI